MNTFQQVFMVFKTDEHPSEHRVQNQNEHRVHPGIEHLAQKQKKQANACKSRGSADVNTFMQLSNDPTACGEHIVHIDGVTGSSPVATTTRLASLLARFFVKEITHENR